MAETYTSEDITAMTGHSAPGETVMETTQPTVTTPIYIYRVRYHGRGDYHLVRALGEPVKRPYGDPSRKRVCIQYPNGGWVPILPWRDVWELVRVVDTSVLAQEDQAEHSQALTNIRRVVDSLPNSLLDDPSGLVSQIWDLCETHQRDAAEAQQNQVNKRRDRDNADSEQAHTDTCSVTAQHEERNDQ